MPTPKALHTRKCVECDKEFTTHFIRKITCSHACALERKLRQMKQWRLNHGRYRR